MADNFAKLLETKRLYLINYNLMEERNADMIC